MPIEIKSAATAIPQAGGSTKIAIVVSTYNHHITNKLSLAAVSTLLAQSILEDHICIIRVPGAWELVYGVQQSLQCESYRGAIALGAVIKGETTHDQHINRAVTMGLMELSMRYSKPVGLGLLTVNTLEQAIQRSGGNAGNKGEEAASALLECLRLQITN